MNPSIFSFTCEQYVSYILSKVGKGTHHIKTVYKQWFRSAQIQSDAPIFKNGQKLLDGIINSTDFSLPAHLKANEENQTHKYLICLGDGMEVEMVVIPMKAGLTLCISSQVGCKMGCVFCETGKMGLIRHLSVEEIVSQLFIAIHILKYPIRNIVFMGMGEPLDNYEAVMQAIDIFTDKNGFGIGASHITISTSGLVPQILRLAKEAPSSLHLAVSVNAVSDEMRNRLMPVGKQYNMAALKEAMEQYLSDSRRNILVEYVLIEGRNSSPQDAQALADYLKGLNVKINLIPLNPGRNSRLIPPSQAAIDEFKNILQSNQFKVFVRETKGQKIWAACGQLGNRQLRKRQVTV